MGRSIILGLLTAAFMTAMSSVYASEWKLVYSANEQGKTEFGSLDALVKAIKKGKEVRVADYNPMSKYWNYVTCTEVYLPDQKVNGKVLPECYILVLASEQQGQTPYWYAGNLRADGYLSSERFLFDGKARNNSNHLKTKWFVR